MSEASGAWRNILVHAGVDPEAPSRLRTAVMFATRFNAQVTGMAALGFDPYAEPGLSALGADAVERRRQDVEDSLLVAEAAFRMGVATCGRPTDLRSHLADPAPSLARASCGADLVVVSPGLHQRDSRAFPPAADLVMGCGTPVLFAPAGTESLQPRCVVIGWKNTRETRRAVADALPLLKIAERVHLVAVFDHERARCSTGEMEDVLRRLEVHGVTADAATWPLLGPSTADELIDWSQRRHADTLVVGAYGHTRRREWLFGGVTADLLAQQRMRVLFGR